ncbi:pyruvate ferredoxin oxidoreductase [Clostridium magnum]|uniref:Pyruvate synthase subunit PorA n=1 Tax=Clostridium magnum DSM 2767 TaxID=1121326 RepID=A0A161WRL4_9CLOT|nr:pyruvate ferredoxin oxidoreductase [Clostridium magnum]KZL89388.1 pyruvate synthase subunit PorA [Clostridium magnum DSM 2767]SHI20772.1 pyruvate ferredoxin oxidoreductase, alpha subunit [Clostridium magnum DSM 2767]
MSIKERLSGNEAIAIAMKQIEPDVMPAFPITPSTEIPQYFSRYVSDGKVRTEFIPVESEHSSMSAAIGAQAAGARTITATSSCGLALMWEMLYVAASNRLPITMAVVNRALSGPININADHSDSMGARDSGWIQIYSENNQEAYDNFVQAMRIGEHKDVLLPVMICQDGFITSHAVENIELIEDEKVKAFVGEYNPEHYLMNPKETMSVGPYDTSAYYIEHKRLQAQAMVNAEKVILEVAEEFEKMTGRKYGLFEEYQLKDAKYAIVLINSTAGTAKAAVNKLRQEGKKVGLLKIRVFRPFPAERIAEALKNTKVIAVMDRSEGFSACGGPVFAEVRSAMFDVENAPKIVNYVYGLGGRDVAINDIEKVYDDLNEIDASGTYGEIYRYLGVRE